MKSRPGSARPDRLDVHVPAIPENSGVDESAHVGVTHHVPEFRPIDPRKGLVGNIEARPGWMPCVVGS